MELKFLFEKRQFSVKGIIITGKSDEGLIKMCNLVSVKIEVKTYSLDLRLNDTEESL